MIVRQFCEPPARSAVAADRDSANRMLADYMAGYAEALADSQPDRQRGVVTDD
ncbi:hypothetical protein [Mycolicibacterium sp. XJ870]